MLGDFLPAKNIGTGRGSRKGEYTNGCVLSRSVHAATACEAIPNGGSA